MNILLTNDDGYDAKGIRILFDKLKKYGKVVIVAPDGPRSAQSASIILNRAVHVKEIEPDIFKMDATPADCVAFGLSMLGISFDLVISGCNHGLNISYDTIYSGTIGACLQSLTYYIPAIAFSCDNNFSIVEKYFDQVMDFILNHQLFSKDYLLNVNFPLGEKVIDIRPSSLYYRDSQTYYIKQEDGYRAVRNIHDNIQNFQDSDCYYVHHGIVSITPLNKTCYHPNSFYELNNKIKQTKR